MSKIAQIEFGYRANLDLLAASKSRVVLPPTATSLPLRANCTGGGTGGGVGRIGARLMEPERGAETADLGTSSASIFNPLELVDLRSDRRPPAWEDM